MECHLIQSTHDRSLLERGKTIHPIIQSTRDRSLLERGKTIQPIIQSTHDRSLSWLGTDNSIKSGRVKLV